MGLVLQVNKALDPGKLHEELAAAGVPVLTVRGFGDPAASGEAVLADNATQQQQTDAAAVITAHDAAASALTVLRGEAKSILTTAGGAGKLQRAVAAVLVDEINSLRQWLASFKAEVAAATSLADLKTRVAGLPNMPDRTLAQAKTAIENKLDSGTVDS